MQRMANLAIIPARGGSKRIPGKNILEIGGRPIIAYSIAAAIRSGVFDDVIVSTDSELIAQTARNWGATVPRLRDQALSGDEVSTIAVIQHEIRQWTATEDWAPHFVSCIYPTNPFVSSNWLAEGMALLENSEHVDFLLSATEIDSRALRALVLDDGGHASPCLPEMIAKRSQDLPKVFVDAGCFYIASTKTWERSEDILTGKNLVFEIPPAVAVDLDTPEDLLKLRENWKRTEVIYESWPTP